MARKFNLSCMLLLSAVFVALAAATNVDKAPRVWLEHPVSIADDRALRLDVQTESIMFRAQVVKLVACSAVDLPILVYDPDSPNATGCASPGYRSNQIYPEQEGGDHSFRARQRSRSLYFKRRLLDQHSPSVWLQATIETRNEHNAVVGMRVEMVRFQVPERVLPIGETNPPTWDGPEGIIDGFMRFVGLRGDKTGNDDDSGVFDDYDVLDGREDLHNGTSTRFYHHVHWSAYTGVIFGTLFLLVLVAVGAIGLGKRGQRCLAQRATAHGKRDDDYQQKRLRALGQWLVRSQAASDAHENTEEMA